MANNLELRYGVSRVIGGRKHQEDEYTCIDNLSKNGGAAFFAVFDGHGTDDYSALASSTLYKKIMDNHLFKQGKYIEAIQSGFAAEDRMLKERVNGTRGGSTSTVAVVVKDQLYIGHLGDSRAVLGVADKQLSHNISMSNMDRPIRAVRVSRDHKPTDPDEKQRILNAGGIVALGRVVGKDSAIDTSRSLGDFDFKLPENRARADFISSSPYVPEPIKLAEETRFLVIGSDGLWNQIEERTVVTMVDNLYRSGLSPSDIADDITERLSGPEGINNVTVIVVFFVWDPSSFPNYKTGAHTNEAMISSHESKVAP